MTLSAIDLTIEFEDKVLFEGMTFSVGEGELLHIKGRNGSGKTSLLKVLASISQPSHGQLYWKNKKTSDYPSDYRRDMAYLGHKPAVHRALNCMENLQVLTSGYNTIRCVDEVLSLMNLSDKKDCLAGLLSAGQQRRLLLAALLMLPKSLWVLDEPYTALDVDGQNYLTDCLTRYKQEGGAIVMSSHLPLPLVDKNNVTVVNLT